MFNYYFICLEYSVGAIYLIIQNLPRRLRYKKENIVLVGVIPGPKEPKHSINSFLRPLVEELKEFWQGVVINCKFHPLNQIYVRAALTCCACDIPATRKLCGFVGHSALLGCSKCLKQFTYDSSTHKMDFSGYDRDSWPNRTLQVHREQCNKYLSTQTKLQRKSIEKDYGIRYSALIDLPYFNPITFAVVDPMHNLLLGTAKHMIQTWLEKEILNRANFEEIEQTVSKIHTPRDVGRIPTKIASGFAGFTADQWRNWVTIFSPVALKGILPNDHLRCWLLYVRACCLLCTRTITTSDVTQADRYLLEFCKQFALLYGEDRCTPNMHLHLHLKQCLLDYGPVASFWCFGFERLNGVLGRYHTNNQTIEAQFMRKFLSDQQVQSLNIPDEANDMFNFPNNLSGSLKECYNDLHIAQLEALAEKDHLFSDYAIDNLCNSIKLLPPYCKKVLSPTEDQQIYDVYKFLYPDSNITYHSKFYESSKKCLMANEMFTSSNAKERSSVIMAYWPAENLTDHLQSKELQVGMIQRFIKHKIKVIKNNTEQERIHIFCQVEWYMKHDKSNWYGLSAILCRNITYGTAANSYIPIQRIAHRCAYGRLDIVIPPHRFTERALVAIPVHMKYSI